MSDPKQSCIAALKERSLKERMTSSFNLKVADKFSKE
jgi:hypothetical protein